MPTPVSDTFISNLPDISFDISNATSTRPPSGVNLKALDRRFITTLPILSSSNDIFSDSMAEKNVRCTCFFSESIRKEAQMLRTYATISPSDKVRCNPAISFLRKSSNWLTRFNKRCALRYISCSLPCSFSSVISFIILSIGDIISVSGVRNSWLTFVKKRNFIWLNSSLFFASSSIWRILNLLRSLRCTV